MDSCFKAWEIVRVCDFHLSVFSNCFVRSLIKNTFLFILNLILHCLWYLLEDYNSFTSWPLDGSSMLCLCWPSACFISQGKVKARRLRTMLSSLNTSALGPCSSPQFRSPSGRIGSLEPRTLSSLTHGNHPGVAAMGKVVFSLASEGRMALWVQLSVSLRRNESGFLKCCCKMSPLCFCSTFGMLDSEETCIVVMVYNTADSWGVLIGDTVVIPEPQVKRNSISHKDEVGFTQAFWAFQIIYSSWSDSCLLFLWQSFDFRSIRVDSPLLLIVNGKKQNVHSQIAASVSYKPQSEWAKQEKRTKCWTLKKKKQLDDDDGEKDEVSKVCACFMSFL